MQVTRFEYTCSACGFCERLHNEITDWRCKRCNETGIRVYNRCGKHGTHSIDSCRACQEEELLQMMYAKNNPFGMFAEQQANAKHENSEINNVWAKKIEQSRKRKKDLEDAALETPKILRELLEVVKK